MKKQTAGRDALGMFAPKFAELNDDILFGEVWSREDKLSLRDRSIITVTALMTKGLIVYFSRKGNNYINGSIRNLSVGNTEKVAYMIKEITGADMFKIEPVIEYDNDYNVCTEEAHRDKRANSRPEFKNAPMDIGIYDTIYLGYPNYWGTMPMHLWTFLEKYDFAGKTIKPFCTHEGSGLGSSERDIQNLCPGAKVERGIAIRGGEVSKTKSSIEKWLQAI